MYDNISDILILGAGDTSDLAKVNPNIIFYLRSKKINVELLTTVSDLYAQNRKIFVL